MSRVWKEFLKNMAWPVGIPSVFCLVGVISGYIAERLGYLWIEGFIVVPTSLGLLFFIVFLTYLEWDRAREKVNRENVEMIEVIKNARKRDTI